MSRIDAFYQLVGLVRWDGTICWLTLHQSSPGALNAQLWLSVDNGRHFTPLWTKPAWENCVERTQPVGVDGAG